MNESGVVLSVKKTFTSGGVDYYAGDKIDPDSEQFRKELRRWPSDGLVNRLRNGFLEYEQPQGAEFSATDEDAEEGESAPAARKRSARSTRAAKRRAAAKAAADDEETSQDDG